MYAAELSMNLLPADLHMTQPLSDITISGGNKYWGASLAAAHLHLTADGIQDKGMVQHVWEYSL